MRRVATFGLTLAGLMAASGCTPTDVRARDMAYGVWSSRAQEDLVKGRYNSAVRNSERAFSLYPERPEAHLQLAGVLVARTQQPGLEPDTCQQYIARALDHHQFYLKAYPENAPANYLVGADLVLLDRPTEAIPYLEKAQQIDPTAPFPDARLGDAYRRMKQYDRAISYYQAGLAKRREPAVMSELHEGLAETFVAQGKTDDAIKELELARKSATGAVQQRRLERRIADLKQATTMPTKSER